MPEKERGEGGCVRKVNKSKGMKEAFTAFQTLGVSLDIAPFIKWSRSAAMSGLSISWASNTRMVGGGDAALHRD